MGDICHDSATFMYLLGDITMGHSRNIRLVFYTLPDMGIHCVAVQARKGAEEIVIFWRARLLTYEDKT